MKKLITILLLSAILFSCSNEPVQEESSDEAVAYAKAIVPSSQNVYYDTINGWVRKTTISRVQKTISYDSVSIDTTGYALPVNTQPPTTPPVDTVKPTEPEPTAGYTLTYSNGFDKLSDLTNNNGQYGNGTVVTTGFLTGPGAFRSRPANVSSGIRSEWQSGTSAQNPTEGAVEYDTYYNYIVKNQCHVVQWHPNTGGASACLAIWHNGGKFGFVYNNGEKQNANWNTFQTQPMMAIQTGKWYHIRIEYKFSLTDGYYRGFIDGKPYASYTGKLGDGSGQYFKLGFNGGFDGNTTEAMKSDIIYDNLKIYKKQ